MKVNNALKPGTRIQVRGFDEAIRETWEDAKIARTMPDMLPMPAGYRPVRFASDGVLLVHESGMRVTDNR